jgi:hypothetical protein
MLNPKCVRVTVFAKFRTWITPKGATLAKPVKTLKRILPPNIERDFNDSIRALHTHTEARLNSLVGRF